MFWLQLHVVIVQKPMPQGDLSVLLHSSAGTQMRYSQEKCRYSCTVSLVRSQDLDVTVCSYKVIKVLDDLWFSHACQYAVQPVQPCWSHARPKLHPC